MLWTNQQVETAMRILGRYSRVCDALPEIEKAVNRKVTTSSLKHAMKQRNADAPSYYLQRDLVVDNQYDRNISRDEFQKVFGTHMAKPPLTDDAVRKAENAWIRNVDKDMDRINNPETVNYGTFTTKPMLMDYNFDGRITDFSHLFNKRPKPIVKSESLEKVSGVVVGEKILRIMCCPDLHAPYHNVVAWNCFLKACETVKPDVLVMCGDFADVLSLSAHQKSPSDNLNFKSELAQVNVCLDQVSALKINRVVFIAGNHCDRIDRFISLKAPELDGMMNIYDLFKLKERGFEYVPYGEFCRIGKMAFTHDVGFSGANASRQSLSAFGGNLIFGHSHRGAVIYGGTVDGEVHVCMNIGHMLDYNQLTYYMKAKAKREWSIGFGFCYQTEDGVTWANFVPIINGRCVVDGKLIDVNA